MKGSEAGGSMVDRAFHSEAIDWIHAIENKEFKVRLPGCFEAIAHRRDIGIELAADVLNVEHQRVEPLQLLRRRSVTLAVKAVNGEAGLFIDAVFDFLVRLSANAMLRAEQRLER